MTEELFILTFGIGTPDQSFGSIDTVAREIHRKRQAMPGQPGLTLRTADVARGELPSGLAVSVRLRDGKENGYGSFLAFVFMPRTGSPCRRLYEALQKVSGASAAAEIAA